MTVFYQSDDSFYDGIHELLKRGIQFKADYGNLTIHMTGGF